MESDKTGQKSSAGSVLDLSEQLMLLVPSWLSALVDKFKPQVTVTNLGIVVILSSFALPEAMTYTLFYPIFRLVFGTLYPAYASYKAVRTKNVKEYVKWMMYWIVFALFTCAETFTDVFLSFWFPFYYEIKIILVLWLLSPATKGSSILYRKFVHPMLSRREQEIDEYIAKAKEQGYHTVLHLGTKGVNYATTVLMQTAIKGGGGLVNQLRRSYSLSDLSSDKESDMNRNSKALKNVPDEDDMEEETDGLDPRMLRPRGYSPRRSASGSGRVEMYFPEVDVDVRQHGSSRPREPSIPLSHIRSSEDVSSGYSSAEPLYAGHHATKSEGLAASREPLVRTASVGSTRSMRTKSSRGGVVTKRAPAAEDSEFLDLQGDEADYYYQEECFYDVSSSSASQPSMSIPFPTASLVSRPMSTVPENSLLLIKSENDVTSSEPNYITSGQEQFTDASDVKTGSSDDEDVPLYDAETDVSKLTSNEFLLPEPTILSQKCDIPTLDCDTSLTTDLTTPSSDAVTNGIIPHPVISSVDLVLPSEPVVSVLNTISDAVLSIDKIDVIDTFTKNENVLLIENESPVVNVKDLLHEQSISQHVEAESVTLIDKKADIPLELLDIKSEDLLTDKKADVPLESLDAKSGDLLIDKKADIPLESLVTETEDLLIDKKAEIPLASLDTKSEDLLIDKKADIPLESLDTKLEDLLIDKKAEIPLASFDTKSEDLLIDKKADIPLEPLVTKSEDLLIDKKADIPLESLVAKLEDLCNSVSDSLRHVEPISLQQPTHTTSEIPETLDAISVGLSASISESLSESKEVSTVALSLAEETVSETQAAMASSPLTFTSAESLSPDNTMDISSESQDSKYDSGVEQSNDYILGFIDSNSDFNSQFVHDVTDKLAAKTIKNEKDELQTLKLYDDSVPSDDDVGLRQTTQSLDSDVKPIQDGSGSAYASVESLSPPSPPSRSESQSSLRKESRAGRYHKRPAPTPPPRNSESENENWTDFQEQINLQPPILDDENSKVSTSLKLEKKEIVEDAPTLEPKEIEESESAVTARLVLKPGVVRSLGPDSSNKTEVFVSKTPQTKGKKSKSKSKQGESSLSRFFSGGITSLIPFWHGKQEAPPSNSAQSERHGNSNLRSSSTLENSSSSAFVPFQEMTPSGVQTQSGRKDTTDHKDSHDKSSSSSAINVREISHSPGQKRRAPLAGWV